ncbi:MAG: cytidylate kinase-like family protein [Lachnospiraceae bacterium]|nr:cytidylate kinase-like family protein [Lachnospiraceae bacterium]
MKTSKYKIVTIEREYGSGGNEVGRILSQKLNIPLHDHSILVEAAKKLDIPSIYISDLEETSSGSIIFNLSQTSIGGGSNTKNLPMAEQLFRTERDIILNAISLEGSGVIVGRCGSEILRDREDCLRIFIYANRTFRLNRAMEKEHLSQAEADSMLVKVDKRRSNFYKTHTGLTWGDPHHFDLCLDSSALGIAETAAIIQQIME